MKAKKIIRNTIVSVLVIVTMLLLSHTSHAQSTEFVGSWSLVFEMPDGSTPQLPLDIFENDEAFRVATVNDDKRTPLESNWEDGNLVLTISLGHAEITCTMFEGKDAFSGSCEGPEDDIPAFMVRRGAEKS